VFNDVIWFRHDDAMRVERRSLLAGAADAQGIVVVIDVLRAFSCSALMFHYGVRDLALVRTPQEALAFRDRDRRLDLEPYGRFRQSPSDADDARRRPV